MRAQDRKENFERLRSKGIVIFILEVGFLRFAIPVSILVKTFAYLYEYGLTTPHFGQLLTQRNIFYFFLSMVLEGLFFGLILWFWSKPENASLLK